MITQHTIQLKPRSRGFHLITDEILSQLPELGRVEQGMVHLFIQHTSASLTLNENADPDVRGDMERYFMHSVPENAPYFRHTLEGADDMPAHIKSSIVGASLTIPVTNGRLAMGIWQGIWLGEHREHGGSRRALATLYS